MLHSWDLTPQEAIALQRQLAAQVVRTGDLATVRTVAGVDVSFNPRAPDDVVHAVVVVLDFPDLQIIDRAAVSRPVAFPYVPGLLSFREAPPLIEAFARLSVRPDLVIVDGHGVAHPRGLGIASHLGLWLDLPTIGCAKSILVGAPASELPATAGSTVDLVWRGSTIGQVVRTRTNVSPVYVSEGHRLARAAAVRWVLACTRGIRLPETTRRAHQYSNAVRSQRSKSNSFSE